MGIRNIDVCLLVLGVLCLSGLASGIGTTMQYYCPQTVCNDVYVTVWADYEYANSDITPANVTLRDSTGFYNLSYAPTRERYEIQVTGNSEFLLYNLSSESTNASHLNLTAECNTTFTECFNATIEIWEQVEFESDGVTRNYDKELTDPYVNDFGWILARTDYGNDTALYEYCNVPFGSGQSLAALINLGNWLSDNATSNITHLTAPLWGCESYWFRGQYLSGQAVLQLPFAPANYSLYLISGSMTWENSVAIPKITHSNIFLPLGDIRPDLKMDTTYDFWVSHAELDFWGTIMASIYPLVAIIGSLLILVLLIWIGMPLRISIGFTLLWLIIWTYIRMQF